MYSNLEHNLERKDANGYQDHEDAKLKVERHRLQ